MLSLVDRHSNWANAGSVNRIQDQAGARLFGIRQARSSDCDAIRDFLAGLSPRTRYLRFFTGAPSTTAATLRLLAGGSDNVDAVVATEAGTIIGHAMAADTTGRHGSRMAEIGVAVTDAWQGQGVGSALTRAVLDRARARGASTVAMDVLAGNQQVLTMIADHWPGARYDHSGGYVTIRALLPQGQSQPSQAPAPAASAAS